MKIVAFITAFLISIAVSFAGGFYLALHYVVSPLNADSVEYESEIFVLQVNALSALQSGSTKEALDFLILRIGTTLAVFGSDDEYLGQR